MFWKKSRKSESQPIVAEYWVYASQQVLPSQETLLRRMTTPFPRAVLPPMPAKEGLLFSDVRFHLGLSLKTKNPDLFDERMPHQERLSLEESGQLKESSAIWLARFASTQPIPDRDYLRFMLRVTDALASLSGGLIYDREAGRFWSQEDWRALLRANAEQINLLSQLRIEAEPGDFLRAYGLRKFGFSELRASAPLAAFPRFEQAIETWIETGELSLPILRVLKPEVPGRSSVLEVQVPE